MDSQAILSGAQDALTARRVFGDPIRVDNVTLIPAAAVSGGIKARPIGVFVVADGDVRWRPAIDVNRVILGGQMVAVTAILVLGPVLRRWLLARS